MDTTPAPIFSDASAVEIGISYLRVSGKRQLNTAADVDPDGNSINTQRDWCGIKAKAMRVMLQKEFVEPAKSGQTIAKRPVFKELLAYLKAHPEVKYVFIYLRSRAFRNHLEAGLTEQQLNAQGVKLISAKEEFGEGIMADAMKVVTDLMNEVQVKLSGQDIAIKMANKAKNGGTNGLAKIGYLNAPILVDGRRVNSIIVDQERAPLVRQAFELFGTGKHTLDSLHEIMADAGLIALGRTKPIGRDTLCRILRERYYTGKLTYKGIEYQGRHEPLISEELFDRVQRILDAHAGSGTRQRQHPHYLKGLVWCGRCKHRYTIMPGRGNGGTYFYFMCRGRQQHLCKQPYVPVDVMEQAVEQHYATTVVMPPEILELVRTGVEAAVSQHYELSEDIRADLDKQLEKLDRKEDYYLDLAGEEGWPRDKLRLKLETIRAEQKQIQRQLTHASDQLEIGKQIFFSALTLLDRPDELYQAGNETVRAILNKALFTKLYVDGNKVVDQELAEPFDTLHAAYLIYRQRTAAQDAQGALKPHPDGRRYHRRSEAVTLRTGSETTLGQTTGRVGLLTENGPPCPATRAGVLARALVGHGSSTPVLVGATGLEPATSRPPAVRATNCATPRIIVSPSRQGKMIDIPAWRQVGICKCKIHRLTREIPYRCDCSGKSHHLHLRLEDKFIIPSNIFYAPIRKRTVSSQSLEKGVIRKL